MLNRWSSFGPNKVDDWVVWNRDGELPGLPIAADGQCAYCGQRLAFLDGIGAVINRNVCRYGCSFEIPRCRQRRRPESLQPFESARCAGSTPISK